MEKFKNLITTFAGYLNKVKFKLLGYGVVGVAAWYGILGLWIIIKIIICATTGICIIFP